MQSKIPSVGNVAVQHNNLRVPYISGENDYYSYLLIYEFQKSYSTYI